MNHAWMHEISAFLARCGAAAVLAVWHVTLLIVLLAVLDRWFGRRLYPQVRLGLWTLVYIRLAALPLAALGLQLPRAWSLELLRQPPAQPAGAVARVAVGLTVWAVGALLVLAVLVLRHQRLRRTLARQDRTVAAGDPVRARSLRQLQTCARSLRLRHTPRLLMTTSLSTPAVLGVLRPVVVMPVALARELPPAALHHVLLHELAHVRRRDPWLQAWGCLLQAVYWFYPLLPWVRRRVAALCELCCDATVAERLRHRTDDYRRTLAECALRLPATPAPALQLSLVAAPVGLFARLHHLEGQPWRTAARRRWTAMVTAGFAAACVLSQAAPPPAPLSPVLASFHQLQRELARENLEAAAAGQWRSCLRLQASALLLFGADPASGSPADGSLAGAADSSPSNESRDPKEKTP